MGTTLVMLLWRSKLLSLPQADDNAEPMRRMGFLERCSWWCAAAAAPGGGGGGRATPMAGWNSMSSEALGLRWCSLGLRGLREASAIAVVSFWCPITGP